MQTYRIEFSYLSCNGRRVSDADLESADTAQDAVDQIRKHYEGFLDLQNTNWR